MTTQTLPNRDEALRCVATVAAALREVIDGDQEQGRALLSELSNGQIAAILPAVTVVLGLLATVEAARKAGS
jgi:hypothetical protein